MSRISFGMLEAGCIPGDLRAFKKEGGKIRLYKGGGGSTTYTQNIPEYAQPYVERMLGATEKQIFQFDDKGDITGFQPYRSFAKDQADKVEKAVAGGMGREEAQKLYSGETVAGFTPLQAQSKKRLENYQVPSSGIGGAAGMSTDLYGRSLAAGEYQAGQYGSQFRGPEAYRAGQFGVGDVGVGTFARPGIAEAYMSPYQQAVTDIEKREAMRASGIQAQQNQAQAVQQGAFGGSRSAIVEAERQRNLGQQLGDIQARGQQSAFQQAQQQFNAENLQAGLQAQLANQQARQQAQQAYEQSRQFGYGQGMTSAQLAAQYGLSAQQLSEQSRQFGADLRLKGISQAQQAAALKGQMEQQQYAQEMGLMGQQFDIGSKEQAYEQARLNQVIQDYATEQQYPFIQLGTLSNMLRGLPMQSSTTQMYQAQPSFFQQAIGAGGTYANLRNAGAFQGWGGKEGGEVKEMAGGGIASGVDPNKLPSMMKKLSDSQLKEKMNPRDTDPETLGIAQAEKQRRDKVRGMANGGIIAFKEGNKVDEVDNPFKEKEAPAAETPKKEASQPKAAAPKSAPVEKSPYQAALKEAMAKPSATEPEIKRLRDYEASLAKDVEGGVEGQIARREAAYTKLGIDPKAMLDQERTEQKQALDQAQGDAKKAEYLRWAQMWAKFGSTPGPILKAALVAIDDTIPDLLDDQERARSVQKNIKKTLFELDKSEYLEKKGKADDAIKADKDARTLLVNTSMEVTKLLAKQEEDRLRVVGGMAEREVAAQSAEKVTNIREQGEIMRAKQAEKRADTQEKKQAAANLKSALVYVQKETELDNKELSEIKKTLSFTKDSNARKPFEARLKEIEAGKRAAAARASVMYNVDLSALTDEADKPAAPAGEIKFSNPEAAAAYKQYNK